ncbi:hypothetical protein V5O48_003886 [Marasmius crinis-equi]|uniref:Uncharacterized protein n=1 Tax=Marasmius crinis-equi TaxID=585013 RepID=A0ABR3FRL1_9AGAR
MAAFDDGKARFLAEDWCLTRACNIYYQNPPLNVTSLDCYEAERRVYCSLCAARHGIEYNFPAHPLPSDFTDAIPTWLPLLLPKKKTTRHKSKTNLGKKERASMRSWIEDFRKIIWSEADIADNPAAVYYPVDFFLSHPVIETILDEFLTIPDVNHITVILETNPYHLTDRQSTRLFSLLQDFRNLVWEQRREDERERSEAKKEKLAAEAGRASDSGIDVDGPPSDGDAEITTVQSGLLSSVSAVHNIPRPRPTPRIIKRAPRQPQPSMAEATDQYGPKRSNNRRHKEPDH